MTVRLVIETEGKGRSFSALVLARVYAPCVWDAGIKETDRHRPAMMLLATAPEEAAPFAANIREGRKMRFHGDGMGQKGEPCEVLRSERFTVKPQRTERGTLLSVRHPDLFAFSPGLISDAVRFVCLPPRARIEQEAPRFDVDATRAHLERCGFEPWSQDEEHRRSWGRSESTTRLVAGIADPLFPSFAALLVAGVAQRVGFPILDEPLFWAQAAAALFADGLALRAPGRTTNAETAAYAEVGVTDCGYFPGAAVNATRESIGKVLARETATFLQAVRWAPTVA